MVIYLLLKLWNTLNREKKILRNFTFCIWKRRAWEEILDGGNLDK